jgi:methyl-accepting chemotaxis protein
MTFKWRNINIGFKYGVALMITILLFIISIVIVGNLLVNINENINVLEERSNEALDVIQIESIINEKDILISDYIHFRERPLIDKFNELDETLMELLTNFEPLIEKHGLDQEYSRVLYNIENVNNIFLKDIIPLLERENNGEVILLRKRVSNTGVTTFVYLQMIREVLEEERNQEMESAKTSIRYVINILIISTLVSLILGIFIITLISKGIGKQLKKVIHLSNKVSEKDLLAEKVDYKGNDEIGKLAKAINNMVTNLQNIIGEISIASDEVHIQSGSLTNVSMKIRDGAEQIAATMEQMAAGAQEQANYSANISKSIYNLDDLIKVTSDHVEVLKSASETILTVANDGNDQMSNSIKQMDIVNNIVKDSVDNIKGLERKAEDISKLVIVIDDISNQTNLLALNAAIEAARAGEAGKGFAVVADEIRKLAEMVSKSLSQITMIVDGIQKESREMTKSLENGYKEVNEGSEQIKLTGRTFNSINTEVIEMNNKIESIYSSLENIRNNSTEISRAGEEISGISQENSAAIEETAASIEQQNGSIDIILDNTKALDGLARKLNALVSQFKV